MRLRVFDGRAAIAVARPGKSEAWTLLYTFATAVGTSRRFSTPSTGSVLLPEINIVRHHSERLPLKGADFGQQRWRDPFTAGKTQQNSKEHAENQTKSFHYSIPL